MQNQKKKIVKSALILGIGAFASKFLGAVYRIPLTRVLTPVGLGLYQLVFPVYTLLLDFSGAGIPSALSKLISSDDEKTRSVKILTVSLKCLLVLGIVGFLIMAIFGNLISRGQGNTDATLSYLFLSPSVLLVSLISCFRGYFQGYMNMQPTAISQIIEQAVKLFIGLLFAYLFLPNLKLSVAGATLGITVSETVALGYLFLTFKKSRKSLPLFVKTEKSEFKKIAKKILVTTVPITLIGIILPFSHVIDSFLTVNIISAYRTDATELYGILFGIVLTVIHLPVSVCYGISSVAIPAVSGAKTKEQSDSNAVKTLVLTFIVSAVATIGIYLTSKFIIGVLFKSLTVGENNLAVSLLKLSSPIIFFLSILQTTNGILIGKGKPYYAILSMLFGLIIKTVVGVWLMKNPTFNIYGSAIALIACYFSSCLINLLLLTTVKVKDESKTYRTQKTEN